MHQFGDMLLVGNSQVGLSTENIGQGEEVETKMLQEADIQSGDTVLLEQSQNEQPTSLEAETINETVSRIVSHPKEYRAKLKNLRIE